ncbi:MAG: hypothetical protein SFX18_09250 [Pirellulales bacterium]|nr:hypothetical protein [Pirellulales bacterium]
MLDVNNRPLVQFGPALQRGPDGPASGCLPFIILQAAIMSTAIPQTWFPPRRGLLLFALWLGVAVYAQADDFRVDSRVYQGKDETPFAENLTIFRGGQIYDFQEQGSEITLYAPRLGRIILLDKQRGVKAEITPAQLEKFCVDLKLLAEKTTDPARKFLLTGQFENTPAPSAANAEGDADPVPQRVFQSPYITYQVQTFTPRGQAIPAQYREFSDLSAQLNALLKRSWPPFARMQVNAALAAEGTVPTKVTLLIPSQSFLGGKNLHYRSEHEYLNRLADSDQQRIAEAEELVGSCRLVAVGEYLQKK